MIQAAVFPVDAGERTLVGIAEIRRAIDELQRTAGTQGAGTITGDHIVAGSITTGAIAAGSITTALLAAGAVTAGTIAAGTITAAQIAAGTITSNEIAANTIVAGDIAAGTITGDRIAAGTITASNIQAATITATQIATDTITAAQIAANAITTSEIAANTIVAGDIAAGTITTTQIAAATITGGNIAASTITATNIAAATITGSLIAAGTITGSNLVAGTITATQIGVSQLSAISADLGTITAGTITGATVRTGSANPKVQLTSAGITAFDSAGNITFAVESATGKVTTISGLGSGNLIPNSGAEKDTDGNGYADGWGSYAGGTSPALDTTDFHAGIGLRSQRVTYDGVGSSLRIRTPAARVHPSSTYTGSVWIKAPAGRALSCSLKVNDAGGAEVATLVTSLKEGSLTATGSWQRLVLNPATIAASGQASAFIAVGPSVPQAGDQIRVDDAQIEQGEIATAYGSKPDEILPDQVTTTELADGLFSSEPIVDSFFSAAVIHADRLVSASITATQIQAATITATQIASATITGGNIAAGTITASNIQAGTITADRLNVTTLSSITANLGTITAGTITGALIQTATSGARVALDTTVGFRAFDASAETFRVNASDGTVGQRGYLPATFNPFTSADTLTFDTTVGSWAGNNAEHTVARNTSVFRTSPASGLLTRTGTTLANGWHKAPTNGTTQFTAGRNYLVTAWVRLNTGAVSYFTFGFGYQPGLGTDAAYAGDPSYGILGSTLSTSQFRQVRLIWTPTANRTSGVELYVTAQEAFVGGTPYSLYIDDISIRDISPPASAQYAIRESVPSGNVIGSLSGTRWDSNAVIRLRGEQLAANAVNEVRSEIAVAGGVVSSVLARYDPILASGLGRAAVVAELQPDAGGRVKEWKIIDSEGNSDLKPPHVTELPSSPYDGQEVIYRADDTAGVMWHLKYRAGSASAYKWEFVGGSPLVHEIDTDQTFTNTSGTYFDPATAGPQIVTLLPGEFIYEMDANVYVVSQTAQNNIGIGLSIGGAQPTGTETISVYVNAGISATGAKTGLLTLASSTTLKMMYAGSTGIGTHHCRWRGLRVTPVRVG